LSAFNAELDNDVDSILTDPKSIDLAKIFSDNLDARYEILSSFVTNLEHAIELALPSCQENEKLSYLNQFFDKSNGLLIVLYDKKLPS
jgi:hypothetical protein